MTKPSRRTISATRPRFSSYQTRRRFGGRQPLCAIGVTSRIDVMLNPAAASARSADSRPDPGPCTSTSSVLTPCSCGFAARILSRHLCGIRCRFARAFEAHGPGRRPGNSIALHVRDQDLGVVERRVHVSNASGDVLGDLLLDALGFACHQSAPLFLFAGNGLCGAFAGASVGVGALATNRKAPTMAQAAVASQGPSGA